MLMVGLEPMETTLAGVQAIAERGGVPVLSPFRPDPVTPMRDLPPPSAQYLEETYLRASEVVAQAGAYLGPTCLPCMHNTVTLPSAIPGGASYEYELPARSLMDRILPSIDDLQDRDIERILERAEELSHARLVSVISGSEPSRSYSWRCSLRTRVGFASAAGRLGWPGPKSWSSVTARSPRPSASRTR